MIALVIFALVVMAMVSLQLFGFRINSLTSAKQLNTARSLKALDQILNQVKGTPNPVSVGNYNTGTSLFSAIANGQSAIGNALRVSNGATSVLTFYLNTNTHVLYEIQAAATSTNSRTLATSITNQQPFQAEDYRGTNMIVGNSGHYTIKVTLQYSNWLYAIPTNVSETYRVEARATPRSQ